MKLLFELSSADRRLDLIPDCDTPKYNLDDSNLRKIKLNLHDVSKIKESSHKELGQEMTIKNSIGEDKAFTLETASFVDNASYNVESCSKNDSCSIISKEVSLAPKNKILLINFSSLDYEGKELIAFSKNYGKIR